MRASLGLTLVLGLAFFSGGCRSTRPKEAPVVAPEMAIRDVQVVWTRGGKLGFLKTYDVAERQRDGSLGLRVTMHYVEDLDFRTLGWVADDGQGERYDYPPSDEAEAKRLVFDRVALPPGSIEDQVRRIFQVDPTTEIAFQRAVEGDFIRK